MTHVNIRKCFMYRGDSLNVCFVMFMVFARTVRVDAHVSWTAPIADARQREVGGDEDEMLLVFGGSKVLW